MAAAPCFDVEVEMVCVIAVIAGSEHCREIFASIGTDGIEEAALPESEEARLAHVDFLAALQLNLHNVDRVSE